MEEKGVPDRAIVEGFARVWRTGERVGPGSVLPFVCCLVRRVVAIERPSPAQVDLVRSRGSGQLHRRLLSQLSHVQFSFSESCTCAFKV